MFSSFEKLPQEKRNLIIDKSMDAFIRNGYLQANTVDIARDCGIAKGSLFHYFSSKKALFIHIAEICSERILNETRSLFSEIDEKQYFDRLRKGIVVKMTIPLKYPKETALLTRAFQEQSSDAAEELREMAARYAKEMRSLNSQYIGEIEPNLIKETISYADAKIFIQTVFDGITTRLLRQYAANPKDLLERPEIISTELEKAINFILHGIGNCDNSRTVPDCRT